MGRYDKIKIYKDATWVQPNQISFKAFVNPARFVYIIQKGSTANVGNHLCQIEVYVNGVNIAVNKTLTAIFEDGSAATVVNPSYAVKSVVDSTYAYITPENGKRCAFILDLGGTYQIDKINVWRYYPDGRTYYETEVATNTVKSWGGPSWSTQFYYQYDGLYAESAAGRTIEWVTLGGNDSTNTRPMYIWDGSSWIRKTLNKTLSGYSGGWCATYSGSNDQNQAYFASNCDLNHWNNAYIDAWCRVLGWPPQGNCYYGNDANSRGVGIGFLSTGGVAATLVNGGTWYRTNTYNIALNTYYKITFLSNPGWMGLNVNDARVQERGINLYSGNSAGWMGIGGQNWVYTYRIAVNSSQGFAQADFTNKGNGSFNFTDPGSFVNMYSSGGYVEGANPVYAWT